jgi:sulfite reductase (NADPH) hemoprotein beta-component
LRHPLSSTLPRKFKIAFEGCADDHALTAINDLGFRGVVVDGRRGFRVLAGGGTGTLPTAARELFPFLPASQISSLAEAVLTVFHRLGDREHKERNRMKFLIRALGFEKWKGEVLREFEDIMTAGVVERDTEPDDLPSERAPHWEKPPAPSIADVRRAAEALVRGPGLVPRRAEGTASYEEFLRTNVREQKQDGFSLVLVTLPLGDVTAPQLRVLGQLALAYGDGTVRLTHEQDLLLRWVRTAEVRGLFDRLEAAGLGLPGANTVSDVTSCPGAESCRLAVTHSRGIGRLLHDHLSRRPEIALLAEDLKVKASGCPNGCGQHHIAGIGLQGSVRQLGGKAVPQYFVMTGGEITQGDTFFAKTVARIPARRLPEAVEALIRLYQDEKSPDETAPAFFRRIGAPRQKALLANLERLTLEEALLEDFVDPGQEGESTFEVDVKAGECAT